MLHEYWLPHFRACVVEGKVCSVMASYNAINGTPNNMNHLLLTDILKKQWGFQGFVVSDLGGVETMVHGHERGKMDFVDAVARSLEAGCDFSDKEFMDNIPPAVRSGKLSRGAAGRCAAAGAARPLSPGRVRPAGEGAVQPHFAQSDLQRRNIASLRSGRAEESIVLLDKPRPSVAARSKQGQDNSRDRSSCGQVHRRRL